MASRRAAAQSGPDLAPGPGPRPPGPSPPDEHAPPAPAPLSLGASLAPALPALLVCLCILAVLLALLLLFSLGPPRVLRRRRHRLSRHEMAPRHRQAARGRSRHRRPAIRGAGDLAALPGTACAHPLASSFAAAPAAADDDDRVSQPLLGRWLDANHDESGLEMDEATWPRPPSGDRARIEVLHWHGSNMLNTSWGWMA